jgi:hypothetical protein
MAAGINLRAAMSIDVDHDLLSHWQGLQGCNLHQLPLDTLDVPCTLLISMTGACMHGSRYAWCMHGSTKACEFILVEQCLRMLT